MSKTIEEPQLENGTFKKLTIIANTEKNREAGTKLLTELIKDFNAGRKLRFQVDTNIPNESVVIRTFPEPPAIYSRFKRNDDYTHDVMANFSLYDMDTKYLREDKELLATLTLCAILSDIRNNKKDQLITIPKGMEIYERIEDSNVEKIASTIKVSEEERAMFLHFFQGKIDSLEKTKNLNRRSKEDIIKYRIDEYTLEKIEKSLESFSIKQEYIAKLQERFMTALGTNVKIEEKRDNIKKTSETTPENIIKSDIVTPEIKGNIKSIRERFLGAIFKKKDLSS